LFCLDFKFSVHYRFISKQQGRILNINYSSLDLARFSFQSFVPCYLFGDFIISHGEKQQGRILIKQQEKQQGHILNINYSSLDLARFSFQLRAMS